MIRAFFLKYFELAFWIAALIALGLSQPTQATHFTLCPLKLMGITWCPGCGLGHAVAFLLHGDLRSSFHAHWLGLPALIIITRRIFDLIRQRIYEPSLIFGNQL
ncbi:DUF2752 domain-containing protein [Mucilaginibacter sp. E4BP6]|uniref:DUF2752 domain-containing protein n=1 Tax=Mucilaginibacter sp. E4BP6 TaxID=2723089 RepID=UPI0015C6EB47|nr:DUF2752 domain-containing protein [Mucilaginibacter sp. E4BP6]NYE64699.1 hypothetical protein [Mucilaginibacter sp. E4BP6]